MKSKFQQFNFHTQKINQIEKTTKKIKSHYLLSL